jgi:hypothetical protein
MRRLVGIVFAVVGVLMVTGGIIVSGGRPLITTGALAILIGLIVFGLSFIRKPELGPDAPPPLSPADRILGVFYEPARIFQNLRYHPRWLAAFLVIALSSIIFQVAFTQRMTPERLATAQAENVIEGGWIPPDKQAEFKQNAINEAKSPVGRIVGPLSQAGGLFILMLILAGLYLLLVMIFGGRINFWQALAVATYSSMPPIVIQSLLGIVLLYIKSPDDIDPVKGQQRGLVHADLGILFSPAEHPYLYTLGSMVGLLTIYGLWLLATGLRNTGEKVSSGAAWGVAILLWLLGTLLALGAAALFPSFVA